MSESFWEGVFNRTIGLLGGAQEGEIPEEVKKYEGPLGSVDEVDPQSSMRLGMINRIPGFENCDSMRQVALRAGKEYYFLVLGIGGVALSLINPGLVPLGALMTGIATNKSKILQSVSPERQAEMKAVAEEFLKGRR